MKQALIILSVVLILFAGGFILNESPSADYLFTSNQVTLDANNIITCIWPSGVFDQNLVITNYAGFEWPKGSGKTAIFTTGLSIGAYVNNQLRLATASYKGEYTPGYCVNGIFHTNSNFKLFKVTRGDNQNSNPDWASWGSMVPYGAPYIDHNHNGIYEPAIDTPGVKDAAQTIFLCMTDADSTTHSSSEGFSGGTRPLFAESHLTAWCYDNPGYGDMQFFKWVIINRGLSAWDSTIYSVFSDPDLGDANDDYIGCDTSRNLGYCFNATNIDGSGTGQSYGIDPPAVGLKFLNCNNPDLRIKSFIPCGHISNEALCERDPSNPLQAYYYMKGLKTDGTFFLNPIYTVPQITKFCYSGDPETSYGWTEYYGRIRNCNGTLSGTIVASPAGDRRFVMSTYATSQWQNPGDTQVVQICQLIARGTNNKNSVTKLKQLADVAQNLCENNFVIGITPISTEVPNSFTLYQNYPNPFNPTTKIRFDIPVGISNKGLQPLVQLKAYDALGREVATLVNEQLNPGTYEAVWDGTNFPSGVYFYRLKSGDFTLTKKLVLFK